MLRYKWSRRFAVVLTLFCLLSTAYNTQASPSIGDRQFVPEGAVARFHAGQSVSGTVISFLGSQGQLGRTWYECYMRSARKEGQVTGPAAINYDPVEVEGKTLCASMKPNPGPRKLILAGETLTVPAGHRVISPIIESVPGRGKTFFKCYMTLPYRAVVFGEGVLDPHPAEVSAIRACSQTTDWNPGRRILTGDGGRRSFLKRDRVVGHLVWVHDVGYPDCYLEVAPANGFVDSGVVNPYPGERELRACLN